MAKDKEQRYQSADEVRRAIADVRAGNRVHVPPTLTGGRERKPRRTLLAAAAVAVLLALGSPPGHSSGARAPTLPRPRRLGPGNSRRRCR